MKYDGLIAEFLRQNGLHATKVSKIGEEDSNDPAIIKLLMNNEVDLVINTMSHDQEMSSDGFVIRQTAIEHNIALLTSLNTADALLRALENRSFATESL